MKQHHIKNVKNYGLLTFLRWMDHIVKFEDQIKVLI